MRTVFAVVVVVGLGLVVAGGAWADESYFPVEAGRTWVYRTAGGEVKVQMGGMAKIAVAEIAGGGSEVEAWPLEGFPGEKVYAIERDGGVVLVERRMIGFAGQPAIVPFAEFRWEGESWEFTTVEGCIVDRVVARRGGEEKITVPAGEFECLRIEIGDRDTYWLARGVGIVKRSDRRMGTEAIWELAEVGRP